MGSAEVSGTSREAQWCVVEALLTSQDFLMDERLGAVLEGACQVRLRFRLTRFTGHAQTVDVPALDAQYADGCLRLKVHRDQFGPGLFGTALLYGLDVERL
jgi:hypothetical protein